MRTILMKSASVMGAVAGVMAGRQIAKKDRRC